MNRKEVLSNLGVAFLAQGVSMLLSVIQALLVPKVLGLQQFSYWQLFLFYVGYVGFFHFGLSSGVYLELGGIPRDSIDKSSVKSQFLFGVAFQTAIAMLLVLLSRQGISDVDRQFVILLTCIALVIKNAATFLMNVLQCMNETKRSSVSTIVERVAFLLPLLFLMISGIQSYRPYAVAYVVSSAAQLIFCLWYMRDFLSPKWLGIKKTTNLSLHSISVGISLMIANIASILILGASRFIIDMRWGLETFGKLSLTLSLVNFFLAFVNQAGLVLFPALRQSSDGDKKSFYCAARDVLALIFPAVYLLYFPLVIILKLWLPDYSDAFTYLSMLLPICVFDSKMSITGSTYFNVLRKERTMLMLNIFTALLSLSSALVGAYIFNSVRAVIIGMSSAIMIRSLLAEYYLTHNLKVSHSALTPLEVGLTAIFLIMVSFLKPMVAFVAYGLLYVAYLFFNRRLIIHYVTKLGHV